MVFLMGFLLAAVLVAVVTGASEALSGQLLTGLVSLVRPPGHRKTARQPTRRRYRRGTQS